jgi:hypothetical protein
MREQVTDSIVRINKGMEIPASQISRGSTLVSSMDDEVYVLSVTKNQTGVTVTTGVGKITYGKNELVNVADGEMYTGIIGGEVSEFIKDIVDYASANDDLECHINGHLFTVTCQDTVKTVTEKYTHSQEDVKNGTAKIYHLA